MAYPTVRSQTAGAVTSSGTSHAVSLPATVAKDDILVVIVALQNSAAGSSTFSWPAGWTELIDTYQDSACTASVGWKIATGTEGGGTVTVTSDKTEKCVSKAFAVAGGEAVYAGASTWAYGAAPNPPNLAPGIGTKDFLWLAIACQQGNQNVSVYPGSYTSTGVYYPNVVWVDDATIAWGRRTTTAASENPGAYTMSGDAWVVGITVAISPRGLIPATLSTVRRLRGDPIRMM